MKIVVLAGGLSQEREVSLVTGTAVCRALRKGGHKAVLVDLFLGLEDYDGPLETVFDAPDGRCGDAAIKTTAPDLEAVRRSRKDRGPSLIGKDVLSVCALADLVFVGLHGESGEDGRIQATLDLLGIPYTGSGHLSSAMAMDKVVTKRLMDAAGIRTPKWRLVEYGEAEVEALSEELPMPCVVKTPGGGSSIGVYMPETREELKAALRDLLHFDGQIIVEERIVGRDIFTGILGDRWLPSVEVISAKGKFDYEAKYQSGGALELCPANITGEQQEEIGEMALNLHRLLGLSVYSRADFVLDGDGVPWCLEINSLPGLTSASLMPKEAAAAGFTYEELCEEIVQLSLRRTCHHAANDCQGD